MEKFPGKGGWTYAAIPGIKAKKTNPFGWMQVKGLIDDHPINNYHLMPMGNGRLFLPVKSAIRKKINKKEGEWIHVILYPDHDPLPIPGEFAECLQDEPSARKFFETLSDSEKKFYVQWIYDAKKEETRVRRIAKAIKRLAMGLKMYERSVD